MSADANQLKTLSQIIQSAALKSSVEDQTEYILNSLSETLNVDVCSFYRKCEDGSLSLVSTHGLVKTHPIVIPAGKGLVGKVVNLRQTINITEPSEHPEYFYFSETNEEQLHSFCGVPVFSRGIVSGVLVVQSYQPRSLNDDQEALISTLAIHLGLLLNSTDFIKPGTIPANTTIKGISGSHGLAIGLAYSTTAASLFDVVQETEKNRTDTLAQWQTLKETAKQTFVKDREILQREMGENMSSLMDAYLLMLDDSTFDTLTVEEIEKGFSLPWALRKTVTYLSELFKAMEDPYLQARHEDLEHLGESLYQLWRGDIEDPADYPDEPIVLVGRSISVSNITKLFSKNLTAIVCTEGAALSHIAVFANALGIPAVMGTGEIPVSLNKLLVVDGDNGQLIVNPDSSLLSEYAKLIGDIKSLSAELVRNSTATSTTLDGHNICLMANSGLNADIAPGLRYGAEGIGLFRTELPFMIRNSLPSENDQYEIYKNVLEKYAGKPVYFRTLDIGSDKPLSYLPELHEENPALGLRGIRYTLYNFTMLNTQIRAILRASQSYEQVHIIFPMISTTEQLDQCLSLLDTNLNNLTEEGLSLERPKIGVMVEVPSCVTLLPMWRKKIDFVSIGTNDLSQYLLAVDRNNPMVSKYFDQLHPAVLHELHRIVQICRRNQIDFSVCGELSSLPLAVVYLIGMGCNKFSLSAAKIPLIKSLIRHMAVPDAQSVLNNALKEDNASAIRKISARYIKDLNLPFEKLLSEAR